MNVPLDAVVLISVVVINLIFALLILLRNARAKTNKLYAVMVIAGILWSIANFYTNHIMSTGPQLLANRLSFAAGYLLILTVWILSLNFPRKLENIRQQQIAALVITPCVLLLTLSSKVVKRTFFNDSKQVTDVVTGPLYFLYVVSLLFFLLLIIINFKNSLHKLQGKERLQVVFSSVSILLAFVWILMTSAILPAITGSWAISKYGDMGTIFLVAITGYAIIKHKLFDIRLVIARSFAYLLSLGSITLLFIGVTYPLSSIFFKDSRSFSSSSRLVFTVLTVILAIIFPYFKRYFDKVTNRLFYRDAYEPQKLLDDFNKALVATYDVEPLLRNSAKVIETYLKSSYALFYVNETDTVSRRIVGSLAGHSLSTEEISLIKIVESKLKSKVIVTDQIDDKFDNIKNDMRSKDFAIVSRLSSVSSKQSVGYLILGPKKSGNLYSDQDIKIIEILTNEMVIALQNSLRYEEIQTFNITLQEKVNDATRKLRRTNEKLKQLDETKDDFISMASHQLRTPLTSVKGYISMVLEEDAGKITATQRDMLGQAFFGSQRMVYLIADLLNVSRLKTGKFIMEPTKINLATMIEQEMSQLRETAAARELTLRFDKPDKFPDVLLDETKTRQVVMNFIDNAIYYTPAGGRIRILLSETASTIEMRVEDDGIGVPKAEQSHLFTKFYRAGNARHARPDGTGLGLFMAKKVILGQGGSVLFDSEEGKGSMFGFVFSKRAVGIATAVQVLPPVSKPQESLAKV